MKHVAVTPEMNEEISATKNANKIVRKKEYRRNPANLNSTLGKRKKRNP